jgi:Tfp pilus assembly PilM family ATPase
VIWPVSTPIGLDIGNRYIKAAQITAGRLTAAVCLPRAHPGGPLDDAELRPIADAIRSGPFRGKSVVLAVPADKLLTSILELPPRTSGAPVDLLARNELARRHSVEPADIEMACWDLPLPVRAANRTCVMAVACRTDAADAILAAVEANGLNVRAMDIHALAVGRACLPLLAETGDAGAILDIGWASSRLVLVYKNTVVYERNLPRCGVGALSKFLAGQREVGAEAAEGLLTSEGIRAAGANGSTAGGTAVLAADPLTAQLESMAGEVRVPLSYLASQYSDAAVRQVLLVGGGAGIPGLAEHLASRLDLRVRRVEPSDLCGALVAAGASTAQAMPAAGFRASMIVAMGLAQYSEGDE